MNYEQMELDLRLDYERDLKTNVVTVTSFAGQKMAEDLEAAGRPLTTIRSKQEAYGVAAQQFVKVLQKQKSLKSEMEDFLKILDGDGEATQIAGTLYNAGIELAQEAVIMAAHAKRILEDLYYTDGMAPLESYVESLKHEEHDEYDEVGGNE